MDLYRLSGSGDLEALNLATLLRKGENALPDCLSVLALTEARTSGIFHAHPFVRDSHMLARVAGAPWRLHARQQIGG